MKRTRERGQTLVMAVIVMFLLTVLGGVFIAMLGRNIAYTRRHTRTLTAQYLSEAGIRYADEQLTNGPDGADWRPVPGDEAHPGGLTYDPALFTTPGFVRDPDFQWVRPWVAQESDGGAEVPVEVLASEPRFNIVNGARVHDVPDVPGATVTQSGGVWIVSDGLHASGPTGGFTRVPYGDGRYLIRINYNPVNSASAPAATDLPPGAMVTMSKPYGPTPLSKYIRIESIGREGSIDPKDPTTFTQTTLVREMVAYKPLGVGDYLLWVTDKEREGIHAQIGVDPFPLDQAGRTFGLEDPLPNDSLTGLDSYYGPIRVNGDLSINGRTGVFLNYAGDGTKKPQPLMNAAGQPTDRGDALEVSGSITVTAPTPPSSANDYPRLWSGSAVSNARIYDSSSPFFDTHGGHVRDGSTSPDANKQPRGVVRLDPPDISAADPTTGMSRYRLLTRGTPSNIRQLMPDQASRAAQFGYGGGIYVDNAKETQREIGGFTLVDDWMSPGNSRSSNWRGHIYSPPGVVIVLLPGPVLVPQGALLDGRTVEQSAGVTLGDGAIRITRGDQPWTLPDGTASGQFTQYFQYPLLGAERPRQDLPPPVFENGIIYTEGNAQVRGKLPPDRKVPVTFAGAGSRAVNTALGQGISIVSAATIYVEGNLLKGDPIDAGTPRKSGIALLAHDYVCVNASGYFAVPPETFSGDWNSNSGIDYHALYLPPLDRYGFWLSSAIDPDNYPADGQSIVSGGTAAGGAGGSGVKQMLIAQQTAESSPGNGNPIDAYVNLFINGRPDLLWNPWPVKTVKPYWEYVSTPLGPGSFGFPFRPASGQENWFELRYNAGAAYWLSRVAVVPLDVRIEAVMYAQERSFFIIPGAPFNQNLNDTRAALDQLKHRPALEPPTTGSQTGEMTASAKSPYPFFNEPLDIKLTIVGSITEGRAPDPKAEEEWTRRWGWTPLAKGSGAMTAHGGDGLAYIYDNDLRVSQRLDPYMRPLPLMPRLPVSPGLVFLGEASG